MNQAIPFAVFKMTGIFQVELLEEFQTESGLSDENTDAFNHSKELLTEICQAAHDLKVRLFIDAEESWIQNTIDQLTYEMMERFNKEQAIIYNTFQMYRHDRLALLKSSHQKALAGNYKLGAKLVRGAYMEKERARALAQGYASPIQANKEASDNDYNAAVDYCLDHLDSIVVFIGTHNEKSCLLAAEKMQQLNISSNHPHVYFSQLYGMSDNILSILLIASIIFLSTYHTDQ